MNTTDKKIIRQYSFNFHSLRKIMLYIDHTFRNVNRQWTNLHEKVGDNGLCSPSLWNNSFSEWSNALEKQTKPTFFSNCPSKL